MGDRLRKRETRSGQFGFPEAVDVAIGIHGDRLFVADAERGDGGMLGIEPADMNAVCGLQTDEADVMARLHGVRRAAYGHFHRTLVQLTKNGKMLFRDTVHRVRLELYHLMAAAQGHRTTVNEFHDHISARGAEKKMGCHNFVRFRL